jgi:hypothetical protein
MVVGTRLHPRSAVRRRAYTTPARRPILGAALLLAPPYDPVLDLEGAFFPAWMLCLLIGIAGTAALRLCFARAGLEPHLGPLPLIYGCLVLLLGMGAWLLFFRA